MSSTTMRASCVATMLAMLGALALGCSGDDREICRFDPEHCPGGEAGAFCSTDQDCRGICCTEQSNCAGGMCTYACNDDLDCPADMACEHHVCFYVCSSDSDCAVGQSCEHNHTVCEWP